MAGERYSKLTIQAQFTHSDSFRADETARLDFTLGSTTITLRRGGQAGQFTVPDPDEAGEQYVLQAVQNVLNLLRAQVGSRGLPFAISEPRANGTVPDIDGTAPRPAVVFDITATDYGPSAERNLAFSFSQIAGFGFPAWAIVENLSLINPVFAEAAVTDTGIFGTSDGAIQLTPRGGNSGGIYLYAWDDGVTTQNRSRLPAGTYPVTVRDASTVASTRLVLEVKQDPQLVVEVSNTANSITLVASGGVAPYTYAWADGASTAARTNLPAGTYDYVVTDAHGARVTGQVVLSAAGRYWFAGNPITLSLDAGQAYRDDPSTKPGLSFVCQVWVEAVYLSNSFEQVGQALEQPADRAGRTTFEVQELLEPFVAPLLPGVGQAEVQRQDGAFRRFYLRYFERTTTGDGAVTTVTTNYLLSGGLGYVEAALGTWFSGYQQAKLPFLTWEPPTKKVLPDQPEFLYFMVPRPDVERFYHRARLTFQDGTIQDVLLTHRTELRRYEVFCLPAGPAQLGLPYHEGVKGQLVVSYTIDAIDQDYAPLSEARTFVLDRRPCPVRRYFLYVNSLGGWNTLVCRGRASREVTTKTSASENARAAGYDPLRGDVTTSRRTGAPVLKCYTGPRSAEQLVADADFLLSERVLLLEQGRYLAGQVKDRSCTVFDEDETRRVVQFDFELPRERYHTPALLR